MNRYALLASLSLLLGACGGTDVDLDDADLAEELDYVAGEGDDDPERFEPAEAIGGDLYDRELENIASTPLFQNFVSRVSLVAASDSGRRRDVSGDTIRFHRL